MAISPVNIARVSQGLRTNLVLNSLQRNQRDVFLSQTRLASGRRFVTSSEDPVGSARALDLTQALARQRRFAANATHGDMFLAAADSSLSEISSLLIEASTIASQNVSNLTSSAERAAQAEVVAAIRQQLQIVGNRQFNGRYIFGGRETTDRPFVDRLGGIAYVGDIGEMFARMSDELLTPINMPGNEVFGALSNPLARGVDLTPKLTDQTRLEDITGAVGGAITLGTVVFNEDGGAGVFTVDLSTADTIGDIVTMINDAASDAGAALTASLSDTGLDIDPGGSSLTVTDVGGGSVTADLGIRTTSPTTTTITGQAIVPRITRLTPVDALAGGAGIDIDSGFIVMNGARTVTIDLSAVETVQDIINTINNAGVGVLSRVSEDGTAIDVFNIVSGTSLTIGENGGTTATDLGIRTFDTATPLDILNFGNGVSTEIGEMDLRITAKNGSTVDVNLDTAKTIGDVIILINDAATDASVSVKASFADTGNGILITDSTSGSDPLSIGSLNLSHAPFDLGLVQTVTGTAKELLGADVNPTRTEGILGALIDLETALRSNDTRGITAAGGRLDDLRADVIRSHGIIGARSQAMTQKRLQLEDASLTSEIFLSQVRDVDYAEAITQLQSAMTRLQANMQTSSVVLNLSLLDFLR